MTAGKAKREIIARNHSDVKERPAKTMGNADRPLVLASTSRYRRALLERLDVPFVVVAPGVDESARPGEAAGALALRLAQAKARAVAADWPDALVIGSDQVADCNGQHVGKPGNRDTALTQLRMLSGQTVTFHTGLALVDARSDRCRVELVDVASTFRVLSDAEIATYVYREQPFDCAGSVKSEALGIALF